MCVEPVSTKNSCSRLEESPVSVAVTTVRPISTSTGRSATIRPLMSAGGVTNSFLNRDSVRAGSVFIRFCPYC